MIPSSLALVPLLPERQAALQAIAAVEHAQQRGTQLAHHPYVAAFMKQLSGVSRISVQGLNRIRGIYLRPREKRAPLPEWESALDIFLRTAGDVCPLPLPGELAAILFPEAAFRRSECAEHAAQKSVSRVVRRERQAEDNRARQLENRICQAEIGLAFHTPDTLRNWFASWCNFVPEHDLKNMIRVWSRRFPSLAGLETLQLYSFDAACDVVWEIQQRVPHIDTKQREMNRWLTPNKLQQPSVQNEDKDVSSCETHAIMFLKTKRGALS